MNFRKLLLLFSYTDVLGTFFSFFSFVLFVCFHILIKHLKTKTGESDQQQKKSQNNNNQIFMNTEEMCGDR